MNLGNWSDRELIEELLDVGSGLTDWEIEFAEACQNHLDDEGSLTRERREMAKEIVRSINGGGR